MTQQQRKAADAAADSEATQTPDVQAAEAAGIPEAEVKALRDDSGLNMLPGHEADIHQWASSEAGKQFEKDAKERDKAAKAAAEAAHEGLDKEGVSEPVKEYTETVEH